MNFCPGCISSFPAAAMGEELVCAWGSNVAGRLEATLRERLDAHAASITLLLADALLRAVPAGSSNV